MRAPFRIRKLHYHGGSVVDVDSDVVVFVGPNNSGKSRTLSELYILLQSPPGQHLAPGQLFVLDDFDSDILLDSHAIQEWLSSRRPVHPDAQGRDSIHTHGQGPMEVATIPTLWTAHKRLGHQLVGHLVKLVAASERFSYVQQTQRTDYREPPSHPVQMLVADPDAVARFKNAFKRVFRLNIIVDAFGTQIRLRVSRDQTQSDFAANTDTGTVPVSVTTAISSVPLLETQGDGVKAFANVLLLVLTMPFALTLIDEPEAFLHPPQAQLLGQYLASLASEGQVFVATHSLDVLFGLLDGAPGRVAIVRLMRERDETIGQALSVEVVSEIQRDSLMRFSRVLDGVFHEAVIVCEGDSDAQFYNAVAASIVDNRQEGAERASDVMFTYAGSKDRIHKVVQSLRKLAVPVRVIADFDALNDRNLLSRMVTAFGVEYTEELEHLRSEVDAGIRGHERPLTADEVRASLEEILESAGDPLAREILRKIPSIAIPPGGWNRAKRDGMAAVPPGRSTEAAQGLLERLRQVGLFLVPTGAVESFVRSVGATGTAWVAEVIDRDLLLSAGEAKVFVGEVLDSLRPTQ